MRELAEPEQIRPFSYVKSLSEWESQNIINNELGHFPPPYNNLLSTLSHTKLPYTGYTEYYLNGTRNDYQMTTCANLDDLLILAANDLFRD